MHIDQNTLLFWAIAFIAAWMQTITGFALGIILMSGVGIFALMPIPEAAIVTSFLVILNGAMVLLRDWRYIDKRAFALLLTGTIPTLFLGYFLLEWLAGTSLWALQFVLGTLITLSALQLMFQAKPYEQTSAPWTFILFGAAGGLMGGLFSTAGPPIIYHLYRQPMALTVVRVTLVAIFMLNQIMRLGIAASTYSVTLPVLWATAGAVPAVMLGTYSAKRQPPPVSAQTVRRCAFGLLFVSGCILALPAFFHLIH